MYADGVRLQRHFLSGDGGNFAFLHHADSAGDGLILVMDHCARFAARNERPVRLICPVGEYLAGGFQSDFFCLCDQVTVGKSHKNKLRIHLVYCLGDSRCQGRVLCCLIIKCAVGFAMLHLYAVCLAECHQSSQLILDICLCILRRACNISASESDEIRIARMGADSNPCFLCGKYGCVHHQRVARMIAAGHVRRGDMRDDFLVQSDSIRAKAFSQVAVQINLIHNFTPPLQNNYE